MSDNLISPLDQAMLRAILDGLVDPIVFCDTTHTIRYMNQAGIRQYEKRGGASLIGQSLLTCHNPTSCRIIHEVLNLFYGGENDHLLSDKPTRRLYMRAVRDAQGEVIGYYERFEYPKEPA